MKKIVAIILCIILVLSVSGCGGDKGPKEITILTLENYLPPEPIKEFSEDTGILVNQVTASSYEEIQTMVEQNPSAYDLIITCDYVIDNLVKGNLLQEIDYKKFDNYKYVMPGLTSKYYDPENKFTVPYAIIGVLIGYNPAKAGILIDSYADLLAPELKNSITFTDDSQLIVGIGNMIVDKDPYFVEEDMTSTLKILHTLSANRYPIPKNTPYPEDPLVNGDASVGLLYTSQLGYAMAVNPDIEIVYPKEGFLASLDCMAIPSGCDGKNYAMQFINYAQDPVVNGKLAQEIGYSSTNISGKQFMDEEYRNDGYNIKSDKAAECILLPKLTDDTAFRFSGIYSHHFISYNPYIEPTETSEQPTETVTQ